MRSERLVIEIIIFKWVVRFFLIVIILLFRFLILFICKLNLFGYCKFITRKFYEVDIVFYSVFGSY